MCSELDAIYGSAKAGGKSMALKKQLEERSGSPDDPRRKFFYDVVDRQFEIYVEKNDDYGDSFRILLDDYGPLSFVIRQTDKVLRLKQLIKNKARVKDESFEDTVRDMVNYGIMYLMWAGKGKTK